MYPQPAKRIASPSMYADGRFQHTLHALRCSSLRHCILSRYENEFKEAPSMNPCLENNKGADKSVPSAYSLFCDRTVYSPFVRNPGLFFLRKSDSKKENKGCFNIIIIIFIILFIITIIIISIIIVIIRVDEYFYSYPKHALS